MLLITFRVPILYYLYISIENGSGSPHYVYNMICADCNKLGGIYPIGRVSKVFTFIVKK